jgi:hypothetical protein
LGINVRGKADLDTTTRSYTLSKCEPVKSPGVNCDQVLRSIGCFAADSHALWHQHCESRHVDVSHRRKKYIPRKTRFMAQVHRYQQVGAAIITRSHGRLRKFEPVRDQIAGALHQARKPNFKMSGTCRYDFLLWTFDKRSGFGGYQTTSAARSASAR